MEENSNNDKVNTFERKEEVKHAPKVEHKRVSHKKEEEKIHKRLTYAAVIQVVLLLYLIWQVSGIVDVAPGDNYVDDSEVKAAEKVLPPSNVDMADLIGGNAIKGDKDAPVTIVEWSDYECPFCARFYTQTYGQILTKYIETGKVKLIYRDFPLGFHPQAQKAAEAAECAGEQGKYYDMHDKLFEEGVQGGVATFKNYAKEIKLDQSKFDKCLDSGAMASEVAKDMTDGQAAGIQGTPGFVINGQLVSGAQPFQVFEQVIEAALSI